MLTTQRPVARRPPAATWAHFGDNGAAVTVLRRPVIGEAAALGLTVISAVAFLVVRPPVGDLFAARARESAVRHGVGLRYWFAWFDGSVPGHYSILEPYVAAVIGSVLLGALSAIAVAAASFVALAPTHRRSAAMGFVAMGVSCNLWSGRVPFLFGMVFALLALICVQRRRPIMTALAGMLAAVITPTAAVFLIIGLLGVLALDGARRLSALAGCLGAGLPVLLIAAYFGTPGPEGFRVKDAAFVMVGLALMLALKTPPQVRIVIALSLVTTLAVLVIPNGLGSNIQRLAWFCLSVVCVATSTSRRVFTYAAAGFTIVLGVLVTARDLQVAAQPMSSPSFYNGLNRELDSIRSLQSYRVESVFDGTHNAAYALLGHAQQARGDETQSDKKFNAVLNSPHLDARSYRTWLDDNAVGYVVISDQTLASSTEDELVRHHRPSYLHRIWRDKDLILYSVDHPTPIVEAPVRILTATQSALTLQSTNPTSPSGQLIRIRWSHLLHISHAPPGSRLERGPQDWTLLHLPAPCQACQISS